jgi:hypothetical protein
MEYAVDPTSRQTEIIIPYIETEWWLMKWSDNAYVCQIIIDHEGMPYTDDIFVYCGNSLYQEWLETEACAPALEGNDTSSCSGLYLHKVATEAKEKIILIDLPLPEAWISITGCTLVPPDNKCDTLPSLVIIGEEPLPNETITRVQGTYNEIPFLCDGASCEVPLRPTPDDGVEITFWVDSSFGDSSIRFKAQVRVTDGGVSIGPSRGGWIVDVMSNRWQDYQAQGCGPIWGSFVPIGGPPVWLSSPTWPELLATDDPYMYLAGRLISKGIVDASDCPGGGLETSGYATTCGLTKARPEVDEWQNRFDAQIVNVAQDTGIPSQLMKNLFAMESQFWPGVFNDTNEFGLGQLTELGADTVLLWNTSFYDQFCPLVLNVDTCNLGYPQLSEEDQTLLRGATAHTASSECPGCPADIDLDHANFSIDLFAQTIMANCQQVGQIITNTTGKRPGSVSSYEDLWLFTLANYHAGPGCLGNAIAASTGNTITWDMIVSDLETDCPGTQKYVEDISR